jgi:uncharacterized membrane protein YphA (DoxX/SURF4 family)
VSGLRRVGRRVVDAWARFWFAPEPVSTIAVVRIAFGFLTLCWTAAAGHDLYAFYSGRGVLPRQQDLHDVLGSGAWGLLGTFTSDGALVAVYVALFAGAVLLLIGLKTRLAAIIVFVGLMALTRRNIWVLDSGDPLMRSIAFFLIFAPSGAAFSLDRRLAVRRGRADPGTIPMRAPWALRLLQLQLSILYLSAAWFKVGGETWRDGTAVSYALRIENLERFPLPQTLTTSELLSNVLTFGTLIVEISIGLLVWNRRLRPWVLLAGVSLHLGIDYALRVGFFSYAILVLYIAFIPPETIERGLHQLRSWSTGRRARAEGAPG